MHQHTIAFSLVIPKPRNENPYYSYISKVVLIDIVFCEYQRLAENHLIALDADAPELACIHRRGAPFQLARYRLLGGLYHQVSQLVGIPENHRGDNARAHIRL